MAWGDSEPVPWGRGHHEEMARRFGHSVGIAVMAEDLPEAANRVDLDPGAKDSNGIPAARVTYRASEYERLLAHGASSARQVLEAAGASRILDSGRVQNFAHYMGTARMGSDPQVSGRRAWNQAATSRTCSSSTAARSRPARCEPDLDDRRVGDTGGRRDLDQAKGVELAITLYADG